VAYVRAGMISSSAQNCEYIGTSSMPMALIHFRWFAAVGSAVLWATSRRDLPDKPVPRHKAGSAVPTAASQPPQRQRTRRRPIRDMRPRRCVPNSACPCAVGAQPTLRWWSAAKQRCCRRTRQVPASSGVPRTPARCSAGCLRTEPPAESSTSQDQAAPPHGKS
jgi:hypothetical protein